MKDKERIARMNDEADQLEDKIIALSNFITESDVFETLDRREKVRLIVQLEHMENYHRVLIDRIVAHQDKDKK